MHPRSRVLRDLGRFIWRSGKFWMLPIIVVLLVFGLLFVIAEGTVLGPLLYTIF
jgi:hypothetical protein